MITIRWNIVLPIRVFLVTMAFNTVLLQILRTVLDFLLTTASELTGLTVDVMEPWSMIRLVFEILMPTMRSVAHTVTCIVIWNISVIANIRAFDLHLLPPILILVMVRNNEIRHHRELMFPLYPLVSEHLLQDFVEFTTSTSRACSSDGFPNSWVS